METVFYDSVGEVSITACIHWLRYLLFFDLFVLIFYISRYVFNLNFYLHIKNFAFWLTLSTLSSLPFFCLNL